jgi:CO/xanthine dehydrogenase FAD-binding subunit
MAIAEYKVANTADKAVDMLADGEAGTKFLAGGTDLRV